MYEEKIKFIIENLNPNEGGRVEDHMDLIDDLGFDSINMLQLIIELEEQFDISISDDDLDIDNFKNIKSITALIEKNYADN